MNFLPGWAPGFIAAVRRPVGVSYIGTSKTNAFATVHTFTNHAIGDADASRIVCVGVAVSSTNAISSVTIGGVAATIVANTTGTSTRTAWAYLAVPAGTTATIVVTMASLTTYRVFVNVYRVVDAAGTPTDTDAPAGGATASRTVTIDVPALGSAIAVSTDGNADNTTWTNATEDNDDTTNGNDSVACAHFDNTTDVAITGRIITANSVRCLSGIAWGPL